MASTAVNKPLAGEAGSSSTPTMSAAEEKRTKAVDEHRRLIKEHRDKETKLRDCKHLAGWARSGR